MHPPSGSDINTRPKTGSSRAPDTSAYGNLLAAEPSRRPEEREASDAGSTTEAVRGAAFLVVGAHPPRNVAGVWVGAMWVDWIIAAVLVLNAPRSRVLVERKNRRIASSVVLILRGKECVKRPSEAHFGSASVNPRIQAR
jgi:hypothetical protein